MRLEKIKFAGFKSFADPLTVAFPSNLVGIVGPNGCGKSNVIDAVRWVMGESSAKQLRGESITDVIFNGSRDRKPIGQASIELIFDNSDGSLTGEYAGYNQISIKRIVDREAQSSYFLNGTRCRRRDITDVFLGTGLNPRGYSIIEQGTISKLVEAKPEELRSYLEEVAGISKYKERRRETESRIKRTLENLDRINDLRDELGKQISHLKRQANAAERYKVLREDERLAKAQLLALRWSAIENDAKNFNLVISKQQTILESQLAELQEIDTNIEKRRVLLTELTDEHQQVQGEYYQVGGEIARLEQAIQHQKERHQQLELDLQETEQAKVVAERNLNVDQEQIAKLEHEIAAKNPEFIEAKATSEVFQVALNQAEEKMAAWQNSWEEFNSESAEYSKIAQVEQTRIQHLEETQRNATIRLEKIDNEKQNLTLDDLESELAQLSAEVEKTKSSSDDNYNVMVEVFDQVKIEREQIHKTTLELDSVRNSLQHSRGRLASLEALQQAALGQKNSAISEWLDRNQLNGKPRLAQGLKVASGWEKAVETVLGTYLEAVCVDDIENVVHQLETFDKGNITLVEKPSLLASINKSQNNLSLLNEKVISESPVLGLLSHVVTADSLNEAISIRKTLNPHESVITKDGVWLGSHWLRVSKDSDAKLGIIQREEEIKTLINAIAENEVKEKALDTALNAAREKLSKLEEQQEELQKQVSQTKAQHADTAARHHVKLAHRDQIVERKERLNNEVEDLRAQTEASKEALIKARENWQEALAIVEKLALRREEFLNQRDTIKSELDVARENSHNHQNVIHELELELESRKTHLSSLQQTVSRIKQQLESLIEREKNIADNLAKNDQPVESVQEELNYCLENRVKIEARLLEAKQKVGNVEHEIRELVSRRQKADETAQQSRQVLEDKKLQHQSLTTRQASLLEQLAETNFELQDLTEAMPEEANEEAWNERIEKIATRIERLGPINLAAIEEHKEASERKDYLDRQNADLEEALTTLQNAIRKIDKETRTKFKDTFDRANQHFQTIFPKVFGGGSARLELTGEDLLTTGVSLYARPPGKRITNIHLLSGGEKALTAISLVFSLFQLNPSPFCLLDEVDAPLDDNNVGRYCDMVKDMSGKVQFIFISHNKLAIEMANHLMGVTMNEPGVSRVVSVDVDAAVAMADG